MNSNPQPILDYAGPRKRSAFRLSSASILTSHWSHETLIIREHLAGHGGALASIAVSFLMVAHLVLQGFLEWRHWHDPATPILAAIFAIGWIVLVPAVIQQSWRETTLRIGDGMMHLTMGGPLARMKYHRTFEQLQAIRVIGTQVADGAPLLAEIEILADNAPPIRLFTDHLESRLGPLAAEIERAVHGTTPPAVATLAPNLSIDALRAIRE
jgi:hypothetical protein